MKRRREAEMVSSEIIKSAMEELSSLKPVGGGAAATTSGGDDDHPQLSTTTTAQVPIKPFLSLCNLLIRVLDKIGPTMAVLRQDIHQNIQRIENFHECDPSLYSDVVEILKKELNEGKATKGPTCSKAFVWLTRSLDFTLVLLQLLMKDFQRSMEQIVEESYDVTLKPWHGWISSAAYKVALRLVPDTKTLINILKDDKDEDEDMLKHEIENLISLLMPVLEHNKDIMSAFGLDKLKAT